MRSAKHFATVFLIAALLLPIVGDPASSFFASAQEEPPPIADIDGDGIPDDTDNCFDIANPDQTDSDADATGDACDDTPFGDPDTDGDGIPDAQDPTPNGDTDGDGVDNATDLTPNGDSDGDGVDEAIDNCVTTPNPDQMDSDGDSLGDACDAPPPPTEPDTDEDGISDSTDPTPNGDTDSDGVDNAADPCPDDATNTCVQAAAEPQVAVTVRTVDSVTLLPVDLNTLVVALDNGGPGMDPPTFTGVPTESGSDIGAGVGVVLLDPGAYEFMGYTSGAAYYPSQIIPVTVTEGMGSVTIPIQEAGFADLSFVDSVTGEPVAGSGINLCATFQVFNTPKRNSLCVISTTPSPMGGCRSSTCSFPASISSPRRPFPALSPPRQSPLLSSPASTSWSNSATSRSSHQLRSFPTIATRCA